MGSWIIHGMEGLRKVKFALFSWVFSWLFSLTIEREMGLESQRGTKGTLLRKEKG